MTTWIGTAGPLAALHDHSAATALVMLASLMLPLAHKMLDQRHERWILGADRHTERFNTKQRGVPLPPAPSGGQPAADQDPPAAGRRRRRGLRRDRGRRRRPPRNG